MTQRVIKFRCWEPTTNTMHYNLGYISNGGSAIMGEHRPIIGGILLQYVGLTDKHGKEIYHNDFIKSSGGDIMLVVWRDDLASFALRKDGWMYDHYFGEAVDAGATEIIGNIYTTPELVDPKMIER